MERTFKNCLLLFKVTFLLSAFTFGGGYVIVPLMKKKFVDTLHWLEEDEMLNIVVIAQSAPGAMAVNASLLLGWRLMGIWGAAAAILGTVLPPLLILSVISLFYQTFRDSVLVQAFLKGTMVGVCAVIFDTVLHMGDAVLWGKEKKILPPLILIGSFILYRVFHVHIVVILILFGGLGAFAHTVDKKKERG